MLNMLPDPVSGAPSTVADAVPAQPAPAPAERRSTILDRLDAVDALELPVAKKAVLRALVRHTKDDGTCHPHVDRIAGMAGVNAGTARRHLTDLEAEGWFTRGRDRRPWDGRLAGYRYVVDVARLIAAARKPQELTPARTERDGPARRERAQEGVTDEGGSFPCADAHAQAAPTGDEGKAAEQQPAEESPMRRLWRLLDKRGRSELYAASNFGGRRSLGRLLDDLVDAGWPLEQLLDELTANASAGAGSVVAVLLKRARQRLDEGPPLDLDAMAAAEATEAHARHLDAVRSHARNAMRRQGATPAEALDDVLAARSEYRHDVAALAVIADELGLPLDDVLA